MIDEETLTNVWTPWLLAALRIMSALLFLEHGPGAWMRCVRGGGRSGGGRRRMFPKCSLRLPAIMYLTYCAAHDTKLP